MAPPPSVTPLTVISWPRSQRVASTSWATESLISMELVKPPGLRQPSLRPAPSVALQALVPVSVLPLAAPEQAQLQARKL